MNWIYLMGDPDTHSALIPLMQTRNAFYMNLIYLKGNPEISFVSTEYNPEKLH
jgi:hypothetical protein